MRKFNYGGQRLQNSSTRLEPSGGMVGRGASLSPTKLNCTELINTYLCHTI
jgi:hypothetical protein